MTIPIFYDDFTDKTLINRISKDPWGRNYPIWKNPTSTAGYPTVENDFEAINGYLNLKTIGMYYSNIESDIIGMISPFFKLEFDYMSLTGTSNIGERINVELLGNGYGYGYGRLRDGHAWLTGGFSEWSGSLLGWNAPTTNPSGSGYHMGKEWHHVEIYRLPNHAMMVLEDGKTCSYGWATSKNIPISIGSPDVGNNTEIWDNPHIYTPEGINLPDVSAGSFTKIRFGWYNGMVGVTNIKLWEYDDTNPYVKYNNVTVPGTGSIAGQILRSDRPSNDWRQPITDAIITDGTRVSYSIGNGAGIYSIINIPPGIYDITVTSSEFTTSFEDTNTYFKLIPTTINSVTVTANQTTNLNIIVTIDQSQINGTGTINGTVTDKYSNHVNNANVYINDIITQTDVNGLFSQQTVEGKFSIIITKPGYIGKEQLCNLIQGTINSYNITLDSLCPPPICNINITQA